MIDISDARDSTMHASRGAGSGAEARSRPAVPLGIAPPNPSASGQACGQLQPRKNGHPNASAATAGLRSDGPAWLGASGAPPTGAVLRMAKSLTAGTADASSVGRRPVRTTPLPSVGSSRASSAGMASASAGATSDSSRAQGAVLLSGENAQPLPLPLSHYPSAPAQCYEADLVSERKPPPQPLVTVMTFGKDGKARPVKAHRPPAMRPMPLQRKPSTGPLAVPPLGAPRAGSLR